MERKVLIDLLSEVAPALANNQLIPILAHFCFNGKTVTGYDGHMGISVACATDFKGGLPPTLLALLNSSRSKAVELVQEDDTMVVKAAKSRFKMAVMPTEDFVFSMPKLPHDEAFPVDAGRFLQGLECCLRSTGNDTSSSDYMGVTLIADAKAKKLRMFSTDRASVSSATVPLKGKVEFDRVVLATEFVKQVLRIGKGATKLMMDIDDERTILKHGEATLFGKHVDLDNNPMDFVQIVDRAVTAANRKSMIDIPTAFAGVLERACIVTDSAVDKTRTQVKVVDGQASFKSKSERGEVTDTCQLKDHPDVSCAIDAGKFKAGYGSFTEMLLTKDVAVMADGELLYLVSTSSN